MNAQGNPTGWQNGDIGSVGAAGSTNFSQFSSGGLTVNGAGGDIGANADAFQYAYRTMEGNGQIIVRIDSQQNTHVWAKAGLMIRESLTAGSRFALLAVTPSNGITFQRRLATGGTTVSTSLLGIKAPWWVKLVRSGDQILAYAHRDGEGWVFVGGQTITLGTTAYVGCAVTSHVNGTLGTSVFSALEVSPDITADEWFSREIGWGGVVGGETYDPTSGTISIRGGGGDIWSGQDTFHFLSQPLVGDGQIKGWINNLSGGDAWARAGLMLRVDDQRNSPNAFFGLTGGYGLAFQRRENRGGATAVTRELGAGAGRWLKLVRSGDEFSSYTSTDAQNWLFVGADLITAPSSLSAGLAITSHQSGVLAQAGFQGLEVERSIEPFGWLGQNFGAGSSTVIGSSLYNPATGLFTVNGAGGDIGGSTDGFHFVWQPLPGDSEISARITSQQNTHVWAKSGVMIRESSEVNARNVLIAVTPGNGLILQSRTATGAATTWRRLAPTYTFPLYLKLRQSGTLVTAFTSQNGASWQEVATVELGTALGTGTHGGLAVTSHNTAATGTAIFDQVNRAFTPFGGLYAVARTATAVSLRWTAAPSIAPAYFDLYNGGSLLDSTPSKALTLVDLQPATPLALTVRPFNAYGQSIAGDQLLTVTTLGLNTLPAPWQTADLGSLVTEGGVSFEDGKFAIIAKGTSPAEAQRLIYQSGWNAVSVSATLRNEDDATAPPARPALVIRQDLSPGSPFIRLGLDAGALVLWKRESAGGTVTAQPFTLDETWSDKFKLTRNGASFTASGYATDGTERVLASGATSLPSNVIAGFTLRVTDATAIHTATFRDVEFTGGDGDDLPDDWEMIHFGNLSHQAGDDEDEDGLTNLQEFQAGTNPNNPDSDGDNVPDGVELAQGRNPLAGAVDDTTGSLALVIFTP